MNVSTLTIVIVFVLVVLYYVLIHIPVSIHKSFEKKLRKVLMIHNIMTRVIAKTEAEQFLIMKSENGGGLPKFGAQIYMSVLYEDYRSPIDSVLNRYQRIQVDSEYSKMLRNLDADNHISFFVHEMKPCLLRDMYEGEGIFWSHVFMIGKDRKAFYYGAINTSQNVDLLKSNNKIEIELARLEIKKQFQSYRGGVVRRIRKALYL